MNHVCGKCNSAFSKASTLSSHLETIHKIHASFSCPKCGYISPSWTSSVRHVKYCKTKPNNLNENASNSNLNDNQTSVNNEFKINFLNSNSMQINSDIGMDIDTDVDNGNDNHTDVDSDIDTDVENGKVILNLTKKLAKIILDTKYEFNVSQVCIDRLVYRFKCLFNEGFELINVSYSPLINSNTCSSNL